jgi:hypothetical protein
VYQLERLRETATCLFQGGLSPTSTPFWEWGTSPPVGRYRVLPSPLYVKYFGSVKALRPLGVALRPLLLRAAVLLSLLKGRNPSNCAETNPIETCGNGKEHTPSKRV